MTKMQSAIAVSFIEYLRYEQLRRVRMACVWFLFSLSAVIASPAQTFTTLYSFSSADGANPVAVPVEGADGNIYGTTTTGGMYGDGTAYRITRGGTLITLHSFDGADGKVPSGLILGRDGNFYGTTQNQAAGGFGTVFKMSASGEVTTLYSFCTQANCADGASPIAGVIQAVNGILYGTTSAGGTYDSGTVFAITPSGQLTTLHSFDGADGDLPSGLVQGPDGNFYGTTQHEAANGFGTVFKITPAGALTTLYDFCSQANCTDGASPAASLAVNTDGKFYGTTSTGGEFDDGTVFSMTSSGQFAALHSFDGADGNIPSGLVLATDGNFYGVTQDEAMHGFGTIFEVTPSGSLTTLYDFCALTNCDDGGNPSGGLAQATNGRFYGTTPSGGTDGDGVVYSLATGLAPFVEVDPVAGRVGTRVAILGSNLGGATGVSFNGTTAAFTVVSSTIIKATVPTGATSGSVTVTTPSGKLTSNVIFRVTR